MNCDNNHLQKHSPFEGPCRIAVIGAGVRGTHLAEQLAHITIPSQVVAVAEPIAERRISFAREYGLPFNAQFDSWETLVNSFLPFDAAIIATLDNQHAGPALACLKRGCHILVEKPLADTYQDCVLIERSQRETGFVVSVCHTLRYMEAFSRIKQIVDSGTLGQIIHIQHMEAIDHLRFTHNYVRGRWAKVKNNTFLLLHKCSHDIDFISWLVNDSCSRVSSFGDLSYFVPSNAPSGSGRRCLDDCQIQETCPYSTMRLYVDNNLTGRIQDLGDNQSRKARLEAVMDGPFGKCVWYAGNDVVDHQTVSMEFTSGTTATCTMTGFSATHGRRTRVQGTQGELYFDESLGFITVKRFDRLEQEQLQIKQPDTYHPEDKDIMENWLQAIHGQSTESIVVTAAEALRTHKIVFAAELARVENRVVEISELTIN